MLFRSAAAIAVLAQDGEPLMMVEQVEAPQERKQRRDSKRDDSDRVKWRIEVGKRHRVEPRQIVGALANEGGLRRSDFGRIEIKPNFSLVELPADLSKETLKKLTSTRISGVLIDMRRDEWQPPRRRAKSTSPKGHRKGQGRPR